MTPRLSVHMMVRNAASVVARALRPLRGIASEVVFVDTGSVDGTPDLMVRLCGELGIACEGVAVSPTSRPDLYFKDVPESYAPHRLPACNGSHLLRNWATARNLGLDLCRGEYVMKLDADDEILHPENILPALDQLDQMPNVELVTCPYEVMEPCETPQEVEKVEMYTRLWRNRHHIRFREVCHENVDWCRLTDGSNWIMVAQGLTVRDWRDNVGADTRVVCRNLKVLLHEYLSLSQNGIRPCSHLLMYLAHEAATVRPNLALAALDRLPDRLHATDAAWARLVRGRCYEAIGLSTDARVEYGKAAALGSPRAGLLSSLMMARNNPSRFREELEQTVAENEGQYYGRHATWSEVREAKALLAQSSSSTPEAPDAA